MAYQVKRAVIAEEVLELLNEDGSVAESIVVRLDADGMAEKVSKEYVNLVNIQQKCAEYAAAKTATPEVLEEMGNAVVSLYNAVFGESDTKIIIDFYEGKYIEMCHNVNPFITEIVIPKVRAIGKNKRKEAVGSYNRKQRRTMFHKV